MTSIFKHILSITGLVGAFSTIICMTHLAWTAMLNGGSINVDFNSYHEGWGEVVYLTIISMIWLFWIVTLVYRRLTKKDQSMQRLFDYL